jgi:hypothetical protein
VHLPAELVGPALLMAIYVVAVSADLLVGDLFAVESRALCGAPRRSQTVRRASMKSITAVLRRGLRATFAAFAVGGVRDQ